MYWNFINLIMVAVYSALKDTFWHPMWARWKRGWKERKLRKIPSCPCWIFRLFSQWMPCMLGSWLTCQQPKIICPTIWRKDRGRGIASIARIRLCLAKAVLRPSETFCRANIVNNSNLTCYLLLTPYYSHGSLPSPYKVIPFFQCLPSSLPCVSSSSLQVLRFCSHTYSSSSAGCVSAGWEDLILGDGSLCCQMRLNHPEVLPQLNPMFFSSCSTLTLWLWKLIEFGGWHVEWEIRRFGWGRTSEWFKRVNTTGFHLSSG